MDKLNLLMIHADGARALLAQVKRTVAEVVDISLAGLGLAGSIGMLGFLETILGAKLFLPPMMASGIIFFFPDKPPNPSGFISGTIGCASLSATILFLFTSWGVATVAAQGAAAGTLLIWYRATRTLFPPAAVLCVLMLAAPTGSPPYSLLSTWLAGHGCLYAAAVVVSAARRQARTVIRNRLADLSQKEL
jgi:hypothetical protein